VDLYNYFVRRQRDLGAPANDLRFEIAEDGRSGRMTGEIELSHGIYVSVTERVELHDATSDIEIVKYSYYILDEGKGVEAFDKDPLHSPALHGHIGPNRRRVSAPEVSLEAVLERAWGEVELKATTYEPERTDQAG
jgi:hypothetical protein